MAELKIQVKADITGIEKLLDQLKGLQTYKMYEGADQMLVDLDDVVKIGYTQTVTVLLNNCDDLRTCLFLYIFNVVYDRILLNDQSRVLIETTVILFI